MARTTTGWIRPWGLIDAASSSSASSFQWRRGWYLPAWIGWMGSSLSSPSCSTIDGPASGPVPPPSRASRPRPSPRFFAAAIGNSLRCRRSRVGGVGRRVVGLGGVACRALCRMHGAFAANDFAGEADVGHGAARPAIVEMNWLAVAGRLGKTHVARNDRAQHLVAKVLGELGRHLVAEVVAYVVHGAQQALDLEFRVQAHAHGLD